MATNPKLPASSSPHIIIPPNQRLPFISNQTGELTPYGMQFLQQLFTAVINRFTIISGSVNGGYGAGQLIFNYARAGVDFTLPKDLPDSVAGIDPLGATATADAIFNLYKNTDLIGTMTIPAGATLGGNTAIFSFPNEVRFTVGDNFRVISPNPADVTLASIFYNFAFKAI